MTLAGPRAVAALWDLIALPTLNLPADQAPVILNDCPSRVVRGGAWQSHAAPLRSASRTWYVHDEHHDYIGFRVARSLVR